MQEWVLLRRTCGRDLRLAQQQAQQAERRTTQKSCCPKRGALRHGRVLRSSSRNELTKSAVGGLHQAICDSYSTPSKITDKPRISLFKY